MIYLSEPYLAYKASGVPWLGDVPAHWEVLPNRAIFSEVSEQNCPGEQMLSVTITNGVIPQRELLEDTSKKDSSRLDRAAYKLVQPGDIAYNKMRAWQGAIGVSKYRGIVSPAYVVQRPSKGTNSHYLHYLLKTPAFAKEAERWSYGITSDMWSLRPEHFKMISACVPPLPEQTAIVRFLDHADRRIRRYIRAKQKLITLLEEQKQAIMHQAVTGPIDVRTGQPYPAYKPSGIEWLGDVPAHWEVAALRRRWRVVDCKHLTVPFVDDGIPLASVREAQSFELNFRTSNRTTPEWYEKLIEGGRKPRPGDLIYCRNVSVGSAALVTTEDRFAMGQDVCLIRSSSENQRWLNYFLRSKVMSDQLALILVGSTFNRINVADIKALLIAAPPVTEQDRIAAFLDDEQSKIAVAIGNCRREQALLYEYRTRLIADVVTGKLDVREAAVALPEVDPLAAEDGLDNTFDTGADPALEELDATLEEAEA